MMYSLKDSVYYIACLTGIVVKDKRKKRWTPDGAPPSVSPPSEEWWWTLSLSLFFRIQRRRRENGASLLLDVQAGDPRSARTNKEAAGYNTANTHTHWGKGKKMKQHVSAASRAVRTECKSAAMRALLCLFPRPVGGRCARTYCHKFVPAGMHILRPLFLIHHWAKPGSPCSSHLWWPP